MEDFNNIKEWLLPLLVERQMTIEGFARQCGLSRAAVYFYISDKNRPESTNMKKMCDVLEVPFEEGLRQYTPRASGRPAKPYVPPKKS